MGVEGENGDHDGKAPPQGSLASLEEVDGLVEPKKKKKRAKKANKVKFDDVSFLIFVRLRQAE
jgi:hypothetical protein